MSNKIDFFISHSYVDKQWAEWITEILEQNGYSTFCCKQDLNVEENFLSLLQEYIDNSDILIAIFSPSYFSSALCQAEVTAMLNKGKNNIISVKISKTQPIKDLSNIMYVDLYNVNEFEAKDRLLKAVESKKTFSRAKDIEKSRAIKTRYPGSLPKNNLCFSNKEITLGGYEKVNAIREAFDKNNTVSSTLALSGLGGTGKTKIVQEYIYQFGYLYDLIWWINAHNNDLIISAYVDFAIENNLINNINVDVTNKVILKKVVKVVKEWMSKTDNWLFVFDDAVDYDVIQNFVPKKHKGNVLITSRKSLWKNIDVNEITVDVFSKETAIDYLKLHGVNDKVEELIKLSSTLGNVPSNLKMAAKYIVENNLTVNDFLKQYDLRENDNNSANTYINIASTYKEQGNYSAAIKYYYRTLKLLENEKSSKLINVYNSIASVYQEMGDYDKAEEIYNEVINICSESSSNNSFELGIAYNNLATIVRQRHEYKDAIQLYNKALIIFKHTLNNQDLSIAKILSNIGFAYCDLKEYRLALEYHYESLSICKNILGLNHPNTAKAYSNIAEIYDIINDYEQSILLYKKSLEIYINALGTDNPYIGTVYSKIASVYQKTGCYDKALNYYNKALKFKSDTINSDEFISSSINIIDKDNTITHITNLSERSVYSDRSKDVIDKITKEVLNDLESKNKNDYNMFNNNFSEFQNIIRTIKKELVFETTENTEICHYSKLSTLKYIIQKKDRQPQPRLRIRNIAYLNDPSEGNVLFHFLKKTIKNDVYNILFDKGNPEENKLAEVPYSKVFIGSFSTAKNKLPMWTLYGDDSTGCCLVFDDYFFDKKNELIESKSKTEDRNVSPQDLTLYRVKYIDVDNLIESDVIVKYLRRIASILDLLREIISRYESVKIWIMTLLDEIRFLFKDCDYDYENEVRIIVHAEDSEIQVDDGQNELGIPQLYINLQRKLMYKEIILGSKINKSNAVAPFLLHSGMVKKVTKSGINYK